MRFTPRPCLQCDDPPCVEACPNKGEGKATWKSTKGISAGIVMINYEQCIGCGRCVVACPYKARNLDAGSFLHGRNAPSWKNMKKLPPGNTARKWPREKYHIPFGTARKCHFCLASAEEWHGAHVCEHLLPAGPIISATRRSREPDLQNDEKQQGKGAHAVKGKGETKIKDLGALKGKARKRSPKWRDIPAYLPVFADTSKTKPRVFYILP